MELKFDERQQLLEGIDMQVEFKRMKLIEIDNRTIEDYQSEKRMHERLNNILHDEKQKDFSIERAKAKDKMKVSKEIEKLTKLREKINENKLLVVPKGVQIHLHIQ